MANEKEKEKIYRVTSDDEDKKKLYRVYLFDRPDLTKPDHSSPEFYLGELRYVFEHLQCFYAPREPTKISPNVYLGTDANTINMKHLRKHGITHLLNCAGVRPLRKLKDLFFTRDWKMEGYEEIPAEDWEGYDIRQHFERAHRIIDNNRSRGRVLIYCPDVNRSAAIAMSYLMSKGMNLLKSAHQVKDTRRITLRNRSFMKQLVEFAVNEGVLERDRSSLDAIKFRGISTELDSPRLSNLMRVA